MVIITNSDRHTLFPNPRNLSKANLVDISNAATVENLVSRLLNPLGFHCVQNGPPARRTRYSREFPSVSSTFPADIRLTGFPVIGCRDFKSVQRKFYFHSVSRGAI